jgi:demethylmenaquinone methyltransferase/2-methoxy-6-polyprenyl-1,4-benzoquinol methylase
MATMFDAVSPRYDLLNQVMSLGQDAAWRRALAAAVPDAARVVVDLCTGTGTSLSGLRRPGRLVLGIDLSLCMLVAAERREGGSGWAPRLVCADAFRLPLATGSLDAVTIAFGVRNLRPRTEALREIGRVLRPGGTFAVLEATAPRGGPLAPLHSFYLRHLVPLAGRLSPNPEAYAYLSRSIFDFGAGLEFEAALGATGFHTVGHRSFLLGATRLWVTRSGAQIASVSPAPLQDARPSRGRTEVDAVRGRAMESEWRLWIGAQAVVSGALTAALAWGLWSFFNSGSTLPLADWQRALAWVLLVGGLIGFGLRTAHLVGRLRSPLGRS